MNTREVRNFSYYKTLNDLGERHKQCVAGLSELGGSATANELARHLFSKGVIPFYNTNYTNPRLIELRKSGLLDVTGTKRDEFTNRTVSVYQLTNEGA